MTLELGTIGRCPLAGGLAFAHPFHFAKTGNFKRPRTASGTCVSGLHHLIRTATDGGGADTILYAF